MQTEQSYLPSEVNQNFIDNMEKVQLFNSLSVNNIITKAVQQTPQEMFNTKLINQKIPQQSPVYTGCANKLCKSYNQSNKDSNAEICLQTLCTRCQQQFQKDSYCIYCKQIYFDETDDGKEWIMCQQCQRWVHSLCADFNTKQNPNAVFQCIRCKKIDAPPHGRRHIPRAGYAKLEKKKNNEFLNSIGFDWQLTPQQIAQDMQQIRKYLS